MNRPTKVGLACAAALALGAAPSSASTATDSTQFSVTAGALAFGTAPDVPDFGAVSLTGAAQTATGQMANYSVVDATGSASGWNVTVNGDSSGGHSAVFKQYCPGGACGAAGYIGGGSTLPANSLTLSSTGASFNALNGTTGTAPTHSCGSGCNVDTASAVKVVSAAANAGMGTYQAAGYGASSLGLSIPSTLPILPSNETFRVDLVWTLSSGP